MTKVPKAKCQKCKHCILMEEDGYVRCDFLRSEGIWKRPAMCSNFKKREGKNSRVRFVGVKKDAKPKAEGFGTGEQTMTDNDIIKALERCDGTLAGCAECPNYKNRFCCTIEKDALDLINRQKAEIERLNEYISRCKSGEEYWVKCLLERPNEAIKEFAERLKEAPIKCALPLLGLSTKDEIEDYFNDIMLQVRDAIDNLVEEMTGEQQ